MTVSFPTIGTVVPGPPEVGEIRLVAFLGAGAFGIVFEGRAVDREGRFAVKFLQAGILDTAEKRQALFDEALAAREVVHPNVLRLLYVGQEAGQLPYLVTEYADSGTLLNKIQQAKASNTAILLELVQMWSLNLMSALAAINARVIHRDVKPDNILFAKDVLKVADFGLAKLVGAATRTNTFKGRQHVLYMAPEGWEGRQNDIQIDMYAVGIVLFELATLRYPYNLPDSDDLEAYRRMHLLQPPANARALRPELPLRFAEVLSRLMSKRPGDRYVAWDQPIEAVRTAFELTPDPAVAPVQELLEQAAKRHRQDIERCLAEETERRRVTEEQEVDRAQEEDIINKLRIIIDQFNKGTEGPKASMFNEGGRWSIQFPYALSATLTFFQAHPPLQIPPFSVRYVALLADNRGCGFNLLLRRQTGDLYGEWVVCRVSAHPLSGYAHRDCEYFGFGPDEVEHIERGHRAIHVFIPEISLDVDAKLEEFVRSLYIKPR